MEDFSKEKINRFLSIQEVKETFIEKYNIKFSDIHPLKRQRIFNAEAYAQYGTE